MSSKLRFMIFQMSNRLHDITLPSYDPKWEQQASKCMITYLKQCEMHPRLLSYRMTQRLFIARKNHKPKQDLTKHFRQEEVSLHI